MNPYDEHPDLPVYNERRVRRRCACAGEISADPKDERDVHEAVVSHQFSEEHGDWADAMGYGRRTVLVPIVRKVA